ncbi:16S rRNA (cytosine(1402)-N(4))-methyltransferase RsmH [Rhodospirillaceae bacterium KN72]|uniref:Ribosomal RNA small subunit methyltransferase H n=1 Tax=Pacificispira spongiicola TaxID=2729598 RepID=A0A7Y0DZL6_9PROT|nr:16S rRNA (cytosine(1402)-N(4))-methyltransferase RsmH [Pacificispira spongiicola]NMM44524.1 16S rRNA (cytosine(1402)-N(4))-methyltransferase RsmH [Pacificispira spongiicola]
MIAEQNAIHLPVMLPDVLTALKPTARETYLDGTFGAGGYSRAILEAADCRLFAIDRDPDAIDRGKPLIDAFAGRLTLLSGTFGDMDSLLAEVGVTQLDGVVLDLGVSSPQIDTPERGFSFRFDGPLDMRMSQSGPSAADVVNHWQEEELARIIWEYGEERFSRRIAKAILRERAEAPIETTHRLAEIVRSCVPRAKDKIDPATRTFQALRIQVNDELGELDRALAAAERLLSPGGRLVVVAFHSLEDKRVKAFLKSRSGREGGGSRHAPQGMTPARAPSFTLPSASAVKPSSAEASQNPRARSARLRLAIRTQADAWPDQPAPSGKRGSR